MLVLGVLLLLLAVALLVGALFLTDGSEVEYAGQAIEPLTLYFSGAVTVLVLVLGLVLLRGGTRRSLHQRREHRRLQELSAKLDGVEAERRTKTDGDTSA